MSTEENIDLKTVVIGTIAGGVIMGAVGLALPVAASFTGYLVTTGMIAGFLAGGKIQDEMKKTSDKKTKQR